MSLARLQSVNTSELLDKLRPFVAEIGKLPSTRRVILFGSMASNKMTDESDIDLAIIVSDDADTRAFKERLRVLKRAHLAWPCDLVVLPESWFEQRKNWGGLCMEIESLGKSLFDIDKGGEIV